jgi:hypothetical protein
VKRIIEVKDMMLFASLLAEESSEISDYTEGDLVVNSMVILFRLLLMGLDQLAFPVRHKTEVEMSTLQVLLFS